MSVQPSPPPRQILANGQQIILPFLCRSRSARSTNWRSGNSRSAHLYKLHFVSFVVRLRRSKTEKRREFSGQDVQLYNRARTAIRLPPGQGCAPTPSTPCQRAALSHRCLLRRFLQKSGHVQHEYNPTAANTAVTAMVATSPRTTPSCRGCNVSPRCRTRWHTRGIWSSRAPVVAPASAAGFLPPVCVGLRTGAVRYTSR